MFGGLAQLQRDNAPVGSVMAPGGLTNTTYQGTPPMGLASMLQLSGMLPGIGDITGPIGDAMKLYGDPKSRTKMNAGLAALELLPLVPSGLYALSKAGGSMDDVGDLAKMYPAETGAIANVWRSGPISTAEHASRLGNTGIYASTLEDYARHYGDPRNYDLEYFNPLKIPEQADELAEIISEAERASMAHLTPEQFAKETADLAEFIRTRGVAYLPDSARRSLIEKGYDVITAPDDIGLSDSGKIFIGLKESQFKPK